MRFTGLSIAAVVCLVAAVQAAPGIHPAPGPLGDLAHKPAADDVTSGGIGRTAVRRTAVGCDIDTSLGPKGHPEVDSNVRSAKGVVQSLVESLYPGLSKTSNELDRIVEEVLSALGVEKLVDGVLGGELGVVDDLARKLGLGVGCLIQQIRTTVEGVLGAAKAKAVSVA